VYQPSTADVINAAVNRATRNLGVALPGTVLLYNASARTCSVQPGVHRLVPSEEDQDIDEAEALPVLQDVPVIWPQGRNFRVNGTLAPGDPVMLVCLDRDMSGWQRTGEASEPDDARTHHWGSSVAIPGLVPDTNPFPAPTDAAALASKLDKLISIISNATAAPVETGLAAIILQIKAPPPAGLGSAVPGFTTGSTILKVSG
jgi:Phage protein Gp138 N-terminal domain